MSYSTHTVRAWFGHAALALVTVIAIGVFVTGTGLYRPVWGAPREEGCRESHDARASQITTMVARFNQFLPGGAAPIELVDGALYTPRDLNALVVAGYCADADLCNQMGGNWEWNGTTRKFQPEGARK